MVICAYFRLTNDWRFGDAKMIVLPQWAAESLRLKNSRAELIGNCHPALVIHGALRMDAVAFKATCHLAEVEQTDSVGMIKQQLGCVLTLPACWFLADLC